MTAEDRFWSKVKLVDDATSCWEWTGDCFPNGRARFYLDRDHGQINAARALWLMIYGDELLASDLICHTCDNPRCVRPDHIYKGNVGTNMADRMRRGRYNQGEANGRSKLDRIKVKYIRESRGDESDLSLSHFFEVDPSTIRRIWENQTWLT